jgi:hypothetical protein
MRLDDRVSDSPFYGLETTSNCNIGIFYDHMSPPKEGTGQPSVPTNLIYQSVLPVKSIDDILEAGKPQNS